MPSSETAAESRGRGLLRGEDSGHGGIANRAMSMPYPNVITSFAVAIRERRELPAQRSITERYCWP